MRIATLIIGLLWGALIFIQSMTAGVFSSEGSETSSAAGAGLLVAVLWLLASALVIAFPKVSIVLFGLAALIGIFTDPGAFEDLQVHGFASIVMAVLAYFGWRGKKKQDADQQAEKQRQLDRDNRLEELLRQQQKPS